jgi:hypothetical protein
MSLPLPTHQHDSLPYNIRRSATAIVHKATPRFTCVTVCIFVVKNSRPLITQTPLFRTTEAYGQFLGRDFNPLAKLLLLQSMKLITPYRVNTANVAWSGVSVSAHFSNALYRLWLHFIDACIDTADKILSVN